MSFKSALRGTQINQTYRQQDGQMKNYDRTYNDDAKAFAHKEHMRNEGVGLFGDAVNLMGSVGGSLKGLSSNLNTAAAQGMNFSFKDAITGKGGFSGDGINNMTLSQVGDTANLQDWMNVQGLDNNFGDMANIVSSKNPQQGLLGYYNKAVEVAKNTSTPDLNMGRLDNNYMHTEYDLGAAYNNYTANQTPATIPNLFSPYISSPMVGDF